MKGIKKNITVSLLFAFSIFIVSFFLYLNFSYMGETDKNVEDLIFGNFKSLIFWTNLKILSVYLLVGAVIGFFTILLGIEKKRNVVKFNIFFWSMYWIRAIKLYPQLFKEQLYQGGTFLKYFQILITDFIPLWVIYLAFILAILLVALKKKRIPAFFVIAAVCFLSIVHFGVSGVKATDHSRPNVLVFGSDSLRPQAISYNGYHRQTPHIDRLFSKGVNFLNTKASMARTFSSFTSILTSTFPPDHHIRHMFPSPGQVDKNWETLVKVLDKEGYHTAVISDFAGDIFSRIDYGFREVKAPHQTLHNMVKQRSLEIHYLLLGFMVNPIGRTLFPEMLGMPLNIEPYYITQYTKESIKKSVKMGKPFFILTFCSNNHFPYASKYPYYGLYESKYYFEKHKYCKDDMMKIYSGNRVPGDDLRQIVGLYDGATKLFDDNLGEVLEFLKRCNLEKNTIVIVMSDHGESLYEKGYGSGHGDHLRGPYSNNMTFGIYSPLECFHGLRVEKTVRDIDIAPTILDLLGISIPGSFRGKSLLPAMRGGPFSGYPAYMETGLWYATASPYINDRIRIIYPGIKEILYVVRETGEIILKGKYEKRMIEAKYKALQLNGYKYIYMPGNRKFREEYYIDEKLVDKKMVKDKDFLSFKEKMAALFKDRFYLDDEGFIREHHPAESPGGRGVGTDVLEIRSSGESR